MFSKVVKLILIGGKDDKIFTTVVVWALCLNLDQITDSYLVNDFRIKTF